jgi:hypothetical protein
VLPSRGLDLGSPINSRILSEDFIMNDDDLNHPPPVLQIGTPAIQSIIVNQIIMNRRQAHRQFICLLGTVLILIAIATARLWLQLDQVPCIPLLEKMNHAQRH